MKWSVLYSDQLTKSSEEISWEHTPANNVIIVWVIFPNGSRMMVSGWDHYVLREYNDHVDVWMWKDKDAVDINGKPMFDAYAGQFSFRQFFNDNTGNKIEYYPNEKLPNFDEGEVKHGVWVDDETARKLGIL